MTDLPQGPTAHAVSDVPAPQVPVPDVLLSARGLEVHFPIRSGGALRRTTGVLRAVDGVDLDIRRGETLGLVGESGCGKSTLGNALLRLVEPTGGAGTFHGTDVTGLDRPAMRALRRERKSTPLNSSHAHIFYAR